MDGYALSVVCEIEKRWIGLKGCMVITNDNMYECSVDIRTNTRNKKHCIWNECDESTKEDYKMEFDDEDDIYIVGTPTMFHNINDDTENIKFDRKWKNLANELFLDVKMHNYFDSVITLKYDSPFL